MRKLTNRYMLIAAALFLVLSGYAVPAQNITSPQGAQALSSGSVASYVQNQSPGLATKSNRFPALAGWFDVLMLYVAPRSRSDESRSEAVRSRTLAATENPPASRSTPEFAW
jgi:hypothetical protein